MNYKSITDKSQSYKEAFQFVNAIVENIPDMIFIKEAKELKFVSFNKAGEKLLGFKREELMGKNDYDFFPKEEANFFTSKDRNVLNSGKMLEIQQETIKTKNNGTRILHTKKIPIFNENNEPEYLLGISEDITDKIKAREDGQKLLNEKSKREQVQKALKSREEFLNIVAHELRTPLSSLFLIVELLEKSLKKENTINSTYWSKIIKLIGESKNQLSQFSELIENILNIGRIKSGKLSIEKKESDLSIVLENTVQKFQNHFVKSGIKLEFEIDPNIKGKFDPIRVNQILTNLITNALKYGDQKPVKLRAFKKANTAYVEVIDQGSGICPNAQKTIFKSFERAESAKNISGFGLGLFISQQFAKAHGGKIELKSQQNKGSTFTLRLPLQDDASRNFHV